MHTAFWVGLVIGILAGALAPVGIAKLKSLIAGA